MTAFPTFPDTSDCVIRLASSDLSKEELVKKIIALNDAGHTVQLFDANNINSRLHILGAYVNARVSFQDKSNVSKTIATEMLLFASMTTQISEAIRKLGIKNTKKFIVFADCEESYSSARKLFKDVEEFRGFDDDIKVLREMAEARLGN